MNQRLDRLNGDCQRYLNDLIEAVNIQSAEDYHITNKGPRILRDNNYFDVGGIASVVLASFLESEGYDVEIATTNKLGEEYNCDYHSFLVVDSGEETIVDAAYFPLIDLFFLDEQQMPKDEILVVPYRSLDEKIREFTALRDLKIRTHPKPEILKEMKRFRESDQELASHFKRVWDYKNGTYGLDSVKQVMEDIAKYNQLLEDLAEYEEKASINIPAPTPKLISYLKQKGLVK